MQARDAGLLLAQDNPSGERGGGAGAQQVDKTCLGTMYSGTTRTIKRK